MAILTGDFLFARASEISSELGTDVTRLLALTIARVCEGQIRELQIAGSVDTEEPTYLEVIERKTAALIATSCRLGGMLSGADAPVIDALERVGHELGLAFQLSDDIMDITADTDTLGKEPGADLREGVYTLPVIYALQHAGRREELRRLLGLRATHGRHPAGGPGDRALRRRDRGGARRGDQAGPGGHPGDRDASARPGHRRADPDLPVHRRPLRRRDLTRRPPETRNEKGISPAEMTRTNY